MIVDVALPRPWWNPLTYEVDDAVVGGRVRVPLNRGVAVGYVLSLEGAQVPRLRRGESLDRQPVLSSSVMSALARCSEQGLCSFGSLADSFLPPALKRGDLWPFADEEPLSGGQNRYVPLLGEEERLQLALEALEECQGTALVLVPEAVTYQRWAKALKEKFSHRLIACPSWTGKAAYERALQLTQREDAIALCGPLGALAPLRRPQLLVIEGEGQGGYMPVSGPSVSGAWLARERFESFDGAILSMSMAPDAWQMQRFSPRQTQRPPKNITFLHMNSLQKKDLKGFEFSLPLAKPLVEHTAQTLAKGHVALWVLDRKAYAGLSRCLGCGEVMTCPQCDGFLGRKGTQAFCPKCGWQGPMPQQCPHCHSSIIQHRNPGLEAVRPLVADWFGKDRVHLWYAKAPATVKERKGIIDELASRGGLVLGSRRALELLSLVPIDLVGWLDGDSEARRPDYAASWQAFSMTLESMTRGPWPRQVYLQTRRPRKNWQQGLIQGWAKFWQSEMVDRQALEFPPFRVQAYLKWPQGKEEELTQKLIEKGIEVQEVAEGLLLWADSVEVLHDLLAPRMNVSQSSKKYPRLTLRRP